MKADKTTLIIRQILRLEKQIESLSLLYDKKDKLIDELVKLKFKKNESFVLVDKFKDKNKAFTATAIRRYALEKVKKVRVKK